MTSKYKVLKYLSESSLVVNKDSAMYMTVHKKRPHSNPLWLRTSDKHGGNRFLSTKIIHEEMQRNLKFNECLEIRWNTLHFLSYISSLKSFCLRTNIKHLTQNFITRSNTSKFVESTPLLIVFLTLFSVFDLLMKRCFLYLIHNFVRFPSIHLRHFNNVLT